MEKILLDYKAIILYSIVISEYITLAGHSLDKSRKNHFIIEINPREC